MASRILANLLVMGSGAVFRAMSQAWQKALENARKSGVTAETAKEAVNKSKSSLSAMMPIEEARKVLDITEHATKDEMLKKFRTMFLKNEGVSFYVQSKLVRAKEQLGKTQFGMEEEEWSRDPREEETKENESKEKEKKLDEGNGGGHRTETETKEKESS